MPDVSEVAVEGQGDPKATVGKEEAKGSEESVAGMTSGDSNKILKHPLQNQWQLWYWRNEKGRDWIDGLLKVAQFQTVEDFWALYNHIELPSNLQMGSDYCLFKTGIKPMWEDDRNRQGGRWLFMLNKKPPKAIDEMWLEILLCLVGEAFGDESDQICGAVINVRPRMDKIAVWTSNCKDEKAVASIGRILKNRTGYTNQINYESHADTQTKTGSSAKHIMTL